jgi:DNA-binding transcriptional MerR regulator
MNMEKEVPQAINLDEILAHNDVGDGFVAPDAETFWMASESESVEASAIKDSIEETFVEEPKAIEVLEMAVPEAANSEASFMDATLLSDIEKIPDKMAFKIGEAAEILDIRPYVLRYWESEFDELRPKKSNHNQRMYSRNDVKVALMIKKLLYKDRFSIEGARKAIKRLRSNVKQEVEKRVVQNKIERNFDKLHALVQDLSALKLLFS